MFGQAVEAIYSHRFYGRGIESEMKLAARQMGNSFYRPKLGLTKWTDAEILAELWKIHPKAEGYCDRHVPRFKKFYKYFHVTRGIPVIQDVEIL